MLKHTVGNLGGHLEEERVGTNASTPFETVLEGGRKPQESG